jgi:membrane fusion protein (multidrug efflux system)
MAGSACNAVHLQPVKVGEQNGANWIIESGLNPGDRVVAEGTQKVKAGTVVTPQAYTVITRSPEK